MLKAQTIVLSILAACGLSSCARGDCVVQNREQAPVSLAALPVGLTVEFCRRGKTAVAESITTDKTESIRFAEFLTHDRPSRYDGSCSDMESARYNYGPVTVALTSKSFHTVKLCYSDSTMSRGVLIATGENCPFGTAAQTAPVDNCGELQKQKAHSFE